MVEITAIPDAWDDDWESQADKADEASAQEAQAKVTKAERLAKHAEANKQIWESAETPETFHFLAARDNVPLKTEFKPALKVLSRKPAPKVVARQDPATGIAQMTIDDEDDEDEDSHKNKPTAEEIRLKAQRDREEKQKKYEEVRARLFGTSESASGASSPGTTTPPGGTEEFKIGKGKSRNKGGRTSHIQENRRLETQSGTRELFDPNYTPKPGFVTIQKRVPEGNLSGRSMPREDEQIIRAPKGPDPAGRGFGFANRGGKDG